MFSLKSTFDTCADIAKKVAGLNDEPIEDQVNNVVCGGVLGIVGALIGGQMFGSMGMLAVGAACTYLGGTYGDKLMPYVCDLENSNQAIPSPQMS